MAVSKSTEASLVTPLFAVRKSRIQGRGAFATTTIRKGQRIIEYIGEKISNAEADRRYDEETMRRHHTFLFTLNSRVVIDGAVGGNASIYINHSCAPNCEAVITGNRIYIHALRTIEPGEELAYDYQYERPDDTDDEMEKFYTCRCGAPTCRGSIMKPRTPKRSSRTRGNVSSSSSAGPAETRTKSGTRKTRPAKGTDRTAQRKRRARQ
jgi:SET domain-containing protein